MVFDLSISQAESRRTNESRMICNGKYRNERRWREFEEEMELMKAGTDITMTQG